MADNETIEMEIPFRSQRVIYKVEVSLLYSLWGWAGIVRYGCAAGFLEDWRLIRAVTRR